MILSYHQQQIINNNNSFELKCIERKRTREKKPFCHFDATFRKMFQFFSVSFYFCCPPNPEIFLFFTRSSLSLLDDWLSFSPLILSLSYLSLYIISKTEREKYGENLLHKKKLVTRRDERENQSDEQRTRYTPTSNTHRVMKKISEHDLATFTSHV